MSLSIATWNINSVRLRINNVIAPHEYAELFPAFLTEPSLRRRNVFAYIDVRDLGQMVHRCLETDGLGYEVFNVANADMSVAATTDEVRERIMPINKRWPIAALLDAALRRPGNLGAHWRDDGAGWAGVPGAALGSGQLAVAR